MTVEEKVKLISDFKKSLEGKTKEELEVLQNEIIESSKEFDKEVAAKEFDLPKTGQKEAFENIKFFLNKMSFKFNYALGFIKIYDYFSDKQTKITFTFLDTVLRYLGELQYTGYDEWKKVENINSYFNPLAEEYRNINDSILIYAEKFKTVDDQIRLYEPVTNYDCNCENKD